MGHFSGLLERPFAIRWTASHPQIHAGSLLIYGFSVVLYCSTRENRRPGEEHAPPSGAVPSCSTASTGTRHPSRIPSSHKMSAWAQWKGTPPQPPANRHRRLRRGQDKVFLQAQSHAGELQFSGHGPKGETMRAVAPLLIEKGYVIKCLTSLTPTAPTPSTHSHT